MGSGLLAKAADQLDISHRSTAFASKPAPTQAHCINRRQCVRATANSLSSTRASRYSLAGRASRHLMARAT
ncbi:hypothetical protein FPT15_21165 [Pseudomonas sp. RGB]|nr:hypothetical protein FPT15_21165 [Pseudomonas sp. RGB]